MCKEYGGVAAVDTVDLDIAPGEFMTLLGPSGSGKSTTLNMIAGFVEPTSGEISLGGRRSRPLPPHRRGIGMVFQHYALFPHMTVAQNVEYPLKQRKIPGTSAGPGSPRRSGSSGWSISATAGRPSCPAGSSSGWRWPGRWCSGRRCC